MAHHIMPNPATPAFANSSPAYLNVSGTPLHPQPDTSAIFHDVRGVTSPTRAGPAHLQRCDQLDDVPAVSSACASDARGAAWALDDCPSTLEALFLSRYEKEKSLEYQEFRRLGYNRNELRVNKDVLLDLMETLAGLPACDDDGSITGAAGTLQDVIELAIQTDVQTLEPAQRRLLLDVVDMTRKALAAVMQTALYVPLARAMVQAHELSSSAMDDLNDLNELNELRAGLQAARKQAGKIAGSAEDCQTRAGRYPIFTALADALKAFRSAMRVLDRTALKPLKHALCWNAGQSAGATSSVCAAMKSRAKGLASGFPTSRQQWTAFGKHVGPWAVSSASAAHDGVATALKLQRMQLAKRYRTCERMANQTLLPFRSAGSNLESVRHDELLKLLIEPIYVSVAACCDIGRRLLTTEGENAEGVASLQKRKAAALTHIERAQNNLAANYRANLSLLAGSGGSSLKSPAGGEFPVGSFVQHMDRALAPLWEGAAKLDRIAQGKPACEGAQGKPACEEEQAGPKVSKQHGQRGLIDAIALFAESQRALQAMTVTFAGGPLDLQSKDWRIARDMGRFFCALRQEHARAHPCADLNDIDHAIDRTIETIACTFQKPRSPDGRQMAVRAKWAFREAIEGLLGREKTWQDSVLKQSSVSDYLVRRGQTSLVGRLTFAGVTGKMPTLFQWTPRSLMAPNVGVVKVLFSPVSFWRDYRDLARSVTPGEAFPWGGYGTMVWRNSFKQGFRMLNFLMPRLGRTGLSAALAAWAVHQQGVMSLAQKSMVAGCIDVPLAAGQVGAIKLANRSLRRREQRDTGSDVGGLRDMRDETARDGRARRDIVCAIGEDHDRLESLAGKAADPSSLERDIASPEYAESEPDQRLVLTDKEAALIKQRGASTKFLNQVLSRFVVRRLVILAKIEGLPEGTAPTDFTRRLASDVAEARKIKALLSEGASIRAVRDQFNRLSSKKISLVDLLRSRITLGELHPLDMEQYSDEIIPARERASAYEVCRGLLDRLIKGSGVSSVKASDLFRIRFKFLNGDGVLETDESAHLPKKASLIDIALGDFYAEHWNGHIVVEGLPEQLAPLFRKNSYYGSIFPVSLLLHDAFKEEYSRLQAPEAKQARLPVWEGLIKRRMAELSAANPKNPLRHVLENGLSGKLALYTLHYSSHAEMDVNNVIALQGEGKVCLINLASGSVYTLDQSALNSREARQQHDLRKLVMDNTDSRNRLQMQIENRWNFYWGDAEVFVPRPPLFQYGTTRPEPGGLTFIAVPSISALAEKMDEFDQKVFQQNFDFRFTSGHDVRVHSWIQGAKLALEKYSLALALPAGGGWFTKALSLGLLTTDVSLSIAQRDTQRTLEARQDVLDDLKLNLLFSGLTEAPEIMTSLRHIKALRAKIRSGGIPIATAPADPRSDWRSEPVNQPQDAPYILSANTQRLSSA